MDLERIVVRMLADATSYTKTMDEVTAKMAGTMSKMVKEGEKDPFAALSKNAQKAVRESQRVLGQFSADHARALEQFRTNQAAAADKFNRQQNQEAAAFAANQGKAKAVFDRREAATKAEYDRRRDIAFKEFLNLGKRLRSSMPTDGLSVKELRIRNKAIDAIMDETATRQAEKDMRQLNKMEENRRKFYERQIVQAKKFSGKSESEVKAFSAKMVNDERAFADRHISRYEKVKERLLKYILAAELKGDKPPGAPPMIGSQPAARSDFATAMIGGVMGGLTVVAINALTNAVFRLNSALVQGGKYAVYTAMEYEVLQTQFEVMTGSAEKGKAMMDELFQIAVQTPFRVHDVVSATKELRAFGFATEDLTGYLKMLGDISAGTGTPMHRLILAFGQAKVAGRLMGQEMRQFVNSNVPLIEKLSEVMHKPQGQIKKMIENGQVGFDQVVKALNLMTAKGGIFFNMMDKMNKTAKGQWNSLVDTIEISLARIGQVFLEEFNIKDMFTEWQQAAQGIGNDSGGVRKFFKDLHEVMLDVWTVIRLVVSAFGSMFRAIGGWVERNKELLDTIKMILLVTTAFRIAVYAASAAVAIFTGLLMVLKTAMGVTAIISLAVGIWSALSAVWFGLGAILTSLGAAIIIIGPAVLGLGLALYKLFSEDFDGVGQSIGKAFDDIFKTFSSMWEGIRDAVGKGDMELAFKILFKGVELAWKQLLAGMHAELKVLWTNIKNDQSLSTELAVLIDPTGALEKTIREDAAAKKRGAADAARRDIADRYRGDIELLQKQLDILNQQAKVKTVIDQLSSGQAIIAEHRGELMGHRSNIQSALAWFEAQAEVDFQNGLPADMPPHIRAVVEKYDVTRRALEGKNPVDQKKSAIGFLQALNADVSTSLNRLERNAWLAGSWFGEQATAPVNPMLRGGGNQGRVPYAISGEAHTVAEKYNQMYGRGVGAETHQYDFFMKEAKFIEEARTGIGAGYKNAGLFTKLGVASGKYRQLDNETAQYALLTEYDKIKKFVGDRTEQMGPKVMLQGSAEAQDVINRSNMRQTSILEQVRNNLSISQQIQQRQLEIQTETNEAIKIVAGERAYHIAPMPRLVGFVGVDAPE